MKAAAVKAVCQESRPLRVTLADLPMVQRPCLPNLEPATGVQALTECTVGVIDYRDTDELLLLPLSGARPCWRPLSTDSG